MNVNNDDVNELLELTRENNAMLKYIIGVINYYIANTNNENEEDFIRNIIANLISNRMY